jgi:hypothetical protein
MRVRLRASELLDEIDARGRLMLTEFADTSAWGPP